MPSTHPGRSTADLRSILDATELPTGDDKAVAVQAMFDTIAGRYDLVNRLMTFGLDTIWRKRTVDALGLPAGATVLDVACGTGDVCVTLRSNGFRPIGVDLSSGMLNVGRDDVPLIQGDASQLPLADASVDGVTCGFALRNFAHLATVLGEMARVVRPGGRISLLEVATPRGALLRAGHRIWFQKAVPLIGGLLSDPTAYRYLPRSVAYLPPEQVLQSMIRDAGFSAVGQRMLTGGVAQLITATRAGMPEQRHYPLVRDQA